MTHPSILPHIPSSPPVECGANDNQWILTREELQEYKYHWGRGGSCFS